MGARLIVLPGSHSKWARIEGGRVAAFKTFVTGELFRALRDHTIAGAFAKAAPATAPGDAFALGVKRGAAASSGEAKAGVLGLLFGARALPLMGALEQDDAGEYLSGLLVGAEIGEARRLYPDEEPHVAGAETLVNRYLAAFEALGVAARAAAPRRGARAFPHRARRGAPMTLSLAPTALIAILRGVEPAEAEAVAAVIVEAGIGAIEVPLNSPTPLASIGRISRRWGDRILVGAGTVLTPREVDAVGVAARRARAGRAQRRSGRDRTRRDGRSRRAAGSSDDDRGVPGLKGGRVGAEALSRRGDCPRSGQGVARRSAEGD